MVAESVYSSPVSAFLPPLAGRPSEASERPRRIFTAMLRRDLPGGSSSDRFAQVNNYTDAVYVAIQRRMKVLMGASVKIMQRIGKKSMPASGSEEDRSSEWTEAPENHPAVKLFTDPNPQQTTGQLLAEYEMMLQTTGRAFLYTVPGHRSGRPVELWVVRTQYVQPMFAASREYPLGAWQVFVPSPMMYGVGSMGNATIDARHMIEHRLPHPMYPQDGYSPLSAMGLPIDILRKINESRHNSMTRGQSADVVVNLPGATDDELAKAKADYEAKYTGVHRGEKVIFTNGVGGVEVKTLGDVTPKDMAFEGGYDQMTKAVLASYGVTGPVSGMIDAKSYAELFASIKQLIMLEMEPEAKDISEFLTKHLIRPHWPDCKLCIDVPAVDDPDRDDRRYDTDKGITTVNERRKMRNMEVFGPEGDVPETIYLESLRSQIQADVQRQNAGAGAGVGVPSHPGSGPVRERDEHGHFKRKYGMSALPAGSGPPAELQSPSPGPASEGSLPPRNFGKSFDVWSMLDEVAPERGQR